MLFVFIAIAIAGLYLLFPGNQIIAKLKGQPIDTTAIHYMQAQLESQPDDIALRTDLAKALFDAKRGYEAMITLKPIVDNTSIPQQTRLLNIEICFQQYFAIQTYDEQKAIEKHLRTSIENLFPQLETLEGLAKLAQWSSELGWPRLSSDIYRTLMKLLTRQDNLMDRAVTWFSDTPKIKTKNPRSVVDYATNHLNALLAADAGAEALDQAKKYVLTFSETADAEKLLELAGKIALSQGDIRQARNWSRLIVNRFDNSSAAITHQIALEKNADEAENSLLWVRSILQQYPNLQSVLYFGCELANALGKNDLAKQWGQQLLSLNPNDSLLLGQQIQFELHMGNVEAALSFALRKVKLNPSNLKARKQLAQIARWAGDTETSMLQWQWLYESTGDDAALTQALELSQGFFRADITVQLLDSVGKRKPLDQQQLDTWFQALEASGLEDAGERHLTTYLLRWPKQKPAWLYLLQAQHQNGHLEAAITTLQTMKRHFGINASEHQIQKIQYWLLLGEPEKAWIIAQNARPEIKSDDIIFWRYYAKLAMLLGKEQALADSYQILLQAGAANREQINWLLGFDPNRDEDMFTQLALSAWRKLGLPNFLLDAVVFQIDKMNWDKARQLMQLSEGKSTDFEAIPRYWTAKSRLAQNLGNQDLAKVYLTRALALSPDSIDIKATLLWFLIDSGDRNQLKNMLNHQQPTAEQYPVLWQPMAAGYRYLHQPARALFWYQKLIQQQPDDYLLLLAYADTLDEIGGKKAARLIRRDTLAKIRPTKELHLDEQSAAETLDLRRQYAWLIRDHLGTEAGNRWLKWLNQQNTLTSAIYEEYRISWYLARNRDQQARYHLLHTQNRNLQLPAWQELAVALKNNELEKVHKVLQQTHDLTPSDRVTGYRAINQESKALLVALQHLNPDMKKSELQLLRQQASDLSLRNPSGFALGAESRNLSNLELSSIKFETAMSRHNHIFNIEIQSIWLHSASKHLRLSKDQSMETLLSFRWHHRGLRSESWLKPNLSLRDDQNLLGISGQYQYTPWNGGLFQVGVAWNEISQESSAFRVQGARDRFTLGLSSELSKREFFALKAHARHYKTRRGKSIGTGFGMDFNADYRIRFANPGWNVSLHGTWHQANIKQRLPQEFARILPRSAMLRNVLSESYREIGIKTHLMYGEMKPFGFVDRQFRYSLEAGMFYAMPPNDFGYHVSANLATRLFGGDEVGFYSHYSDAQGGVNTRATMDLGIRYSRRF